MSSGNLLSSGQQRRPLGEGHRMGQRRWDVLEQPGHVDPQGRQEASIPHCLGPSPVTHRGVLQEKLTRFSCKEKKADNRP